ncbi:WXG100 family type VII secretion target [Allostreptomyces psammosilenae]|uniref:Uncharacterized protein n=1 Tax=Allostreptomyces psammosilenae TaxID=1892865 RepID=A0A852ZWY7_9ACTN|nr:hypothetical protein [Allostreptomyces psammosilenae]NYI06515.1 hypothetical protein [Allostreptomyces psammosilenae]
MSAGYHVDFDGMSRLVVNMSTCADDMGAAVRSLRDIGPRTTGHSSLDDACSDFQDRWSYGVDLLKELTTGMVGGLEQTVASYAELETRVGQLFPGLDGGGGGAGSGGATPGPVTNTPAPAPSSDFLNRLRGEDPPVTTMPAPAPEGGRPGIADVMRGEN